MKKGLLILLMGIITGGISAQEINTDQYAIITKRTADWCSRCGQHGWALFKDLVENKGDKPVIIWAAHASGGLANDASEAITSNFGGSGQPVFYVNDSDLNVTSSNYQDKTQEALTFVDELALFPAFVGLGIEATIDENATVTINAKAQFQQTLQGDYHMAIYEVRNHLISNQASVGAMADHLNVLTGVLSDDPFGDKIGGEEVAGGEEFTITKSIENFQLHSDNVADVNFVVVVWNKNNNYRYINAGSTTLQMVSNTTAITADQIAYVVEGDQLMVTLPQLDQDLTVSLQTLDGKVLTTQAAAQNMRIDVGALTTGMYIINLRGSGVNTSQKVMITK